MTEQRKARPNTPTVVELPDPDLAESPRADQEPASELATVTVPTPEGPAEYPDLSARLRAHLEHGGQVAHPWIATRDAGHLLLTRPQLDTVEVWVSPERVIGFALLARFTRSGRGRTVPRAEYVGASRIVPVRVAAEAAGEGL